MLADSPATSAWRPSRRLWTGVLIAALLLLALELIALLGRDGELPFMVARSTGLGISLMLAAQAALNLVPTGHSGRLWLWAAWLAAFALTLAGFALGSLDPSLLLEATMGNLGFTEAAFVLFFGLVPGALIAYSVLWIRRVLLRLRAEVAVLSTKVDELEQTLRTDPSENSRGNR